MYSLQLKNVCCTLSAYTAYAAFTKTSQYATAQRTFNRFCQNEIAVSWRIHLRLCTQSFVKFVRKNVRNIWKKRTYHFFSEHGLQTENWERCAARGWCVVWTLARWIRRARQIVLVRCGGGRCRRRRPGIFGRCAHAPLYCFLTI